MQRVPVVGEVVGFHLWVVSLWWMQCLVSLDACELCQLRYCGVGVY
jgi:hypothetical protein